jgi:hypothetical protein
VPDLLRVEAGERIDLGDFQQATDTVVDASLRTVLDQVLTNPAGSTRAWILSGFELTNAVLYQATVTRGSAIFARREGAQTLYGSLAFEGDSSRTVDLATYANGTYGVYIRFEYIDSDIQNRIFWNPTAPGSEYARSLATRRRANWSMRVELTTPGSEWTKIGEVTKTGVPGLSPVDMRKFYFEGPVNSSFQSGWSTDGGGGANDRSASRQTYGIRDFQTFTAAMRQCLEDIKGRGLRRWWSRDIGGMNVGFDAAPVEDRVAVGDADFYLAFNSGNPKIQWETTSYQGFSRSLFRWQWYANSARLAQLDSAGFTLAADTFGLIYDSTDPTVTFAATEWIKWSIANNRFEFRVGGNVEAAINANGIVILNGLYVGGLGGVPVDNQIYAEGDIRTGGIFRSIISATSGAYYFGTTGDNYIGWDGTNMEFVMASNVEIRMTASGINIINGLHVGGTTTPVDNNIAADGDISAAVRFHGTPSGSSPSTPALGDIYPDSDGTWKSYSQLQGATASWGTIGEVRLAVTTVSNAQFLGMPTTPITLVSAQGANTLIVPVAAILHKQYNGTNTANGSMVTLTYQASGTWSTDGPANTPINDGTADEMFTWIMGSVGGVAAGGSSPFNTSLTMSVAGAAFTGGNTTFKVYVWYTVMRVE